MANTKNDKQEKPKPGPKTAAAKKKTPRNKGTGKKKQPTGKGGGDKKGARKGRAVPKPSEIEEDEPLNVPVVLAKAPKVIGTLKLPGANMYGSYKIVIEVDRERADDITKVNQLLKYQDPTVVAFLVPIKNSTQGQSLMALDMDAPELGVPVQPKNECDINRLQDILGLTKSGVGLKVREGIIAKLKRGVYDLDASVRNLIEELRAKALGRGGQEQSDQKTRKIKANANREELKYLMEAGELGYIKDFELEMTEQTLKFREAVEAIPSDLDAGLTNEQVKILVEEIKTMLKQLSIKATSGSGKRKTK